MKKCPTRNMINFQSLPVTGLTLYTYLSSVHYVHPQEFAQPEIRTLIDCDCRELFIEYGTHAIRYTACLRPDLGQYELRFLRPQHIEARVLRLGDLFVEPVTSDDISCVNHFFEIDWTAEQAEAWARKLYWAWKGRNFTDSQVLKETLSNKGVVLWALLKHFGITSILRRFILQGSFLYFDMLNIYADTNLRDYSQHQLNDLYTFWKTAFSADLTLLQDYEELEMFGNILCSATTEELQTYLLSSIEFKYGYILRELAGVFGAQECFSFENSQLVMRHLERNGVQINGSDIHNYPYLLNGLHFRRFRHINNTIWKNFYAEEKIQKIHPTVFRFLPLTSIKAINSSYITCEQAASLKWIPEDPSEEGEWDQMESFEYLGVEIDFRCGSNRLFSSESYREVLPIHRWLPGQTLQPTTTTTTRATTHSPPPPFTEEQRYTVRTVRTQHTTQFKAGTVGTKQTIPAITRKPQTTRLIVTNRTPKPTESSASTTQMCWAITLTALFGLQMHA